MGEDFVPPITTQGALGSFAVSAAARTGIDPVLAAFWGVLLEMKKGETRTPAQAALP